jgi:DNA-binding NtrC family response regulator
MTNGQSQQDSGGEAAATILVVDDELMVRRVCRRVLEREGYLVLCAAGSEQAIEAVRESDTPIDVLLCDVVMPGVPGGELAVELRMLEPGVAVIFISGHVDDSNAQTQIDNGNAGFLAKPFFADELLEVVAEALVTQSR